MNKATKQRLELHKILCELMDIHDSNGDRHVYFQPPASIRMKYPAIKYSLSDINNTYADNISYKQLDAYEVILIDADPDSIYINKLSQLPYCRFDRYYPSDNLNHYVFTLYY